MPTLSVCPESAAFLSLFSFMKATKRSKIAAASGLTLLLSKSKSTSSRIIVRSTFGAGFGAGGEEAAVEVAVSVPAVAVAEVAAVVVAVAVVVSALGPPSTNTQARRRSKRRS